MTRPYERFSLIDAGKKGSVTAEKVAQRLSERDQRMASDTRTDAQKLLAEPEPARSALSSGVRQVQNTLFVPVRTQVGRSHTSPNSNPAMWKLLQNK